MKKSSQSQLSKQEINSTQSEPEHVTRNSIHISVGLLTGGFGEKSLAYNVCTSKNLFGVNQCKKKYSLSGTCPNP